MSPGLRYQPSSEIVTKSEAAGKNFRTAPNRKERKSPPTRDHRRQLNRLRHLNDAAKDEFGIALFIVAFDSGNDERVPIRCPLGLET